MNDYLKNALDCFDEYFPFGKNILDEIRRTRIDFQTCWQYLKNREVCIPPAQWLTIEVTNLCNSNCIFCAYQYQSKFRMKRGVISDEIFNKAIEDFKQIGGKNIGLTPFSGEPLLDKKIINRIKKIKAEGFWTGFFTNGIMLNYIDALSLLKSGVDGLTVSTAPFDSKAYEMIYRNNHYADVLNGLKNLLTIRNQIRLDLPIGIAFRSHIPRRRALSLPDFREIIMPLLTEADWKLLTVNTRGFDSWGGVIKSEDLVGMMRLALNPRMKSVPCSWLSNLYVTWEGQVRACPCRYSLSEHADGKDDLYLGNLRQVTLFDMLNGERLKRLYMKFKEKKLPDLCQQCTMYKPLIENGMSK